jgi:hypothetical protein
MDLVKEVQKRFKKAGFYQAMLESDFFNGSDDLEPEAAEVRAEIKYFIAERMAELMGLGNNKPVKDISSTLPKVNDVGPSLPKVDPYMVEEALGAKMVEVINPATGLPVKVNVQGQTVDNNPKRLPPPNWNDPTTLAIEQAKAEQVLQGAGKISRVITKLTGGE